MSALVVAHYGRAAAYGAEELKQAAHRYAFLALSISILIHFSVIGFYYLNSVLDRDVPLPKPPGPIIYVDFPTSPMIPGIVEPPPPGTTAIPKTGDEGAPDPVADNLVPKDKSIASQGDLANKVDPHGVDLTPRELPRVVEIPPDIDSPPDTFVFVEKDPVIVTSVVPVYPPLALKAEIEGKVFVKMWVDWEGKVRQASVVKSDNEIFNESAIAAAKQFVFTPAYMNSGPVSVWVGMPFRFRLRDAK